MKKGAAGAKVAFCGHNGWFLADIYYVGNVNVIRANGKITGDNLNRPATPATHHVSDFPTAGFWKPELGVLVVPEEQVQEVKDGKVKIGKKWLSLWEENVRK